MSIGDVVDKWIEENFTFVDVTARRQLIDALEDRERFLPVTQEKVNERLRYLSGAHFTTCQCDECRIVRAACRVMQKEAR